MIDRRQFLSRTAAGVGVALAATHPLLAQLANMPAKLADPAQFSNDQEAYWTEIRMETGSFLSAADSCALGHAIRVISWNINRGEQLDGVLEFLRRTPADLILLQETDVNARRTQYRNVAREIAQALRMNYVFGCEFEELAQGNHSSPAYHGQATLSNALSDCITHPLDLAGNQGFGAPVGTFRSLKNHSDDSEVGWRS